MLARGSCHAESQGLLFLTAGVLLSFFSEADNRSVIARAAQRLSPLGIFGQPNIAAQQQPTAYVVLIDLSFISSEIEICVCTEHAAHHVYSQRLTAYDAQRWVALRSAALQKRCYYYDYHAALVQSVHYCSLYSIALQMRTTTSLIAAATTATATATATATTAITILLLCCRCYSPRSHSTGRQ
eukprot:17556-Heterococcus_DN1.PRE.4